MYQLKHVRDLEGGGIDEPETEDADDGDFPHEYYFPLPRDDPIAAIIVRKVSLVTLRCSAAYHERLREKWESDADASGGGCVG